MRKNMRWIWFRCLWAMLKDKIIHIITIFNILLYSLILLLQAHLPCSNENSHDTSTSIASIGSNTMALYRISRRISRFSRTQNWSLKVHLDLYKGCTHSLHFSLKNYSATSSPGCRTLLPRDTGEVRSSSVRRFFQLRASHAGWTCSIELRQPKSNTC